MLKGDFNNTTKQFFVSLNWMIECQTTKLCVRIFGVELSAKPTFFNSFHVFKRCLYRYILKVTKCNITKHAWFYSKTVRSNSIAWKLLKKWLQRNSQHSTTINLYVFHGKLLMSLTNMLRQYNTLPIHVQITKTEAHGTRTMVYALFLFFFFLFIWIWVFFI